MKKRWWALGAAALLMPVALVKPGKRRDLSDFTGKTYAHRGLHGPGVPEKDRQRIFRRFARGEECRTGKEHFGLGLSIARQIALLHGGKLWVEDAPGGGAVFFLQLPAGR